MGHVFGSRSLGLFLFLNQKAALLVALETSSQWENIHGHTFLELAWLPLC